jgi:hypothetical protein
MKIATAKEIQTDILTSMEALISEANRLVQGKDETATHIAGLSELGFTGSATVLEMKAKAAKELHDLHDMYSFEFPGLKFIPKAAMVNVCNKYGLAIGHVSRYRGEVPGWALERIKANKRHIPDMQLFDADLYYKAMTAECQRRVDAGECGHLFSHDGGYARHYGEDVGGTTQFMMGGRNVHGAFPESHGMRTVPALYIAAPVADMALKGNERVVDGKIQTIPTKDPIVCLEVKGGYIVLAAWGEEGSDPEVFNAANN